MDREFEILLERFRTGSLTPAEAKRLHELLRDPDTLSAIEVIIDDKISAGEMSAKGDIESRELMFQTILLAKEELDNEAIEQTIPFQRRIWRFAGIAASVLIAVGLTAYLFFLQPTKQVRAPEASVHDVLAPKANRAILTLANGSTVPIDSVQKGTLAIEGEVKVIKTSSGEIQYAGDVSGNSLVPVYNVLYNPRGSRVLTLTLNDGTRVWLNSESSLRYPVAFDAGERRVEITGEAYFEVAHDEAKPFFVSANRKGEIKVLGTHFNVNAYDDEPSLRVTLLEGRVAFSARDTEQPAILGPGQQADLKNNEIKVKRSEDLAAVTAWKDNRFYFMGDDIETIRRQLSRWYDVDITLTQPIPDHFTAVISRDVNASEVFSMLQKTGTMNVTIEGKKITISR